MKDFLLFRRMIMPWLIMVAFWGGSLTCLASAIYCLYHKEWGLVFPVLILGPLGLRLVCEWLILIFRLNETLTDIKYALEVKKNHES